MLRKCFPIKEGRGKRGLDPSHFLSTGDNNLIGVIVAFCSLSGNFEDVTALRNKSRGGGRKIEEKQQK